eukprot:COSAG06_NODE_30022_length_546_cov_0.928412_1_plen_36_part_01
MLRRRVLLAGARTEVDAQHRAGIRGCDVCEQHREQY